MKNWVPFKLEEKGGQWKAAWVFLGEHMFLAPFFEETTRLCKREAEALGKAVFTTELEELAAVAAQLTTVKPTAFIFHISRCGSTLFTQLLSLQSENIVVSEAPVFDDILRLKYKPGSLSDTERLNYFQHAARIIGQKRTEAQQRYFIKCDSWHLFFLDEIRRCYPDTPFIFLTRAIPKVMASHQKLPGMQAMRGLLEPAIFGLTMNEALAMSPDAYLELILGKMVATTHGFVQQDANSLLLPYEDGALENFTKMLEFLGQSLSETDFEDVKKRLQFHSKSPKEQFSEAI